MVDLVKIRKKAKKALGVGSGELDAERVLGVGSGESEQRPPGDAVAAKRGLGVGSGVSEQRRDADAVAAPPQETAVAQQPEPSTSSALSPNPAGAERELGVGSGELEQRPAGDAVAAKRGLGVGSGVSEQRRDADAVTAPAPEPAVAPQPEPSTSSALSPTPHPPLPTPTTTKLEKFKVTAGQRHEGFFEREAETASAGQVELLTFIIAGEQYAVSIENLVEIITPRAATPVPNADPTIVGIVSLRGTMVTVIDVRRKLRHPPADGGNDARVIVVQRGSEVLGFQVDRVLRVLKVDSAAVEPHPVVHSSELSEAVRGVFRQGNALTILLDLDKLLAWT